MSKKGGAAEEDGGSENEQQQSSQNVNANNIEEHANGSNQNLPANANEDENANENANAIANHVDTRHPLGMSDESLAGWLSMSAESSTMVRPAASTFGASSAGGSSSRQPSRPGAYAMTPTSLATALRRSSNEFGNSAASGRRRRGQGGASAGANGNANGNESDDDDDGSSVHYAVGMTVPVAPPEESNGDDGTAADARSGRQQHRGSESLPSMSTYAIAEPMELDDGSSAAAASSPCGRSSKSASSSSSFKHCIPLILVLAVVGIVVGVTVPLVGSSRGSGSSIESGTESTDGGAAPTMPPSSGGTQPATEEEGEAKREFEIYVQNILDPFYYQPATAAGNTVQDNKKEKEEKNINIFRDPTSSQSLALDWVVSQDAYSRSAYAHRHCPNVDADAIVLQRYVLAVMYYSTDGTNWDDSLGFLSPDTAVCEWNVYDDAEESLVGVAECGIDVNENTSQTNTAPPSAGDESLSDTCDGVEMSYSAITSLVLARNGLLGTIPSELGLLSGLKILDLSTNGLESTIPRQLGLISTSLETLDLGEVGLVGSLPPELFVGASRLQYLGVWGNGLTGTLPQSLGDCASLKALSFPSNQISGPLPTEIGQMPNLESLVFWRNSVTGSIPTELGNCQSLHTYSSPFNGMTGPFPTEMGQITNLTTVFAYENMHSGQIPSELGNLPKLEVFNVAINNLSGTLPTEIGQISSLRRFRYFENIGIVGTVPSEITSLPLLEDVWTKDTQLGAPFPSVFHPESSLRSIHVSAGNSACTGTVPTEIWSLPKLQELEIFNTTMTGRPIPDVLPESNNVGQMSVMKLSSNGFSGTLPSIIGSFQSLTKLWLQDNVFVGDVPSELSNLQSLVELQIQGNDFDSVPPSMCNLRNASGGGLLETYVSDCDEVGCTCCTECL